MSKKYLYIIALIVILLGGIFIGYTLKGQKLMVSPQEQKVVMMKMQDAIKNKIVTPKEITYEDISAARAKEMLDSMAELITIDVSTNYMEGHLPVADNYPLGDDFLENIIANFDMEEPYLVYAHDDETSISGAQQLIDAGYTRVYRLKGNFSSWVAAGYDVEK